MTQPVDVAQLAFAVENFLRPFASETEGFGERSHQLDYLRDMVVILAIFGAGLGVEKIVPGD